MMHRLSTSGSQLYQPRTSHSNSETLVYSLQSSKVRYQKCTLRLVLAVEPTYTIHLAIIDDGFNVEHT